MDVTTGARPIRPHPAVRVVGVDRADGATTIDDALIEGLHRELDAAQADPACRIVLLTSATPGVFSTGMNLVAAGSALAPRSHGAQGFDVQGPEEQDEEARRTGGAFFDLLLRFTSAPLIVACAVDGRAAGGGVGLVAACDQVFATAESSFALPEALWGLLPCCVLPFLMRRVGFQRAYSMTLTTRPAGAAEAAAWGLVDEVAPDPAAAARRLALRADKIDGATVAALKTHARRLWELSDAARETAVGELGRLMASPAVRRRIGDYAAGGRFPWER